MPYKTLLGAVALVIFLCCPRAHAQPAGRKEPLAVQVKTSMDRGIAYLKTTQRRDGGWEIDVPAVQYRGGSTALAVLALLNCELTPEDKKVVDKGLDFLRSLETEFTYVRALQTMAYAEGRKTEDLQRIRQNVQWLLDGRIIDGQGRLQGWGYGKGEEPRSGPDNSNSQYALLGLWAGKQAGVQIDEKVWQQIIDFYKRSQNNNGSWSYVGRGDGKLTMTTAGLCGLLIAGMEIGTGREGPLVNGVAKNCGLYDENPEITKAVRWIGDNIKYDFPVATFYNVYGIERAGRLSGMRFFGEHDWYREGSEYLVKLQDPQDGSWTRTISPLDRFPVISTSFALLFLSKGRTPILISKVVHTTTVLDPFTKKLERDPADTDWNNDRNDLRNLTQFASKSLFNGAPMAWQSYDMLRAAGDLERKKKLLTEARAQGAEKAVKSLEEQVESARLDIVSEMLQSPIMYFNGHKSPLERFQDVEIELLREYVDNGGFLFVEACCGKPDFDAGFKALAEKLWPNAKLKELGSGHPVWNSKFAVKPNDPYRLLGVEMGCKTVLIYSPADMSCRFEANNLVDGDRAFKLGANIIAYATGLEPPQPRLTKVELPGRKQDSNIPRGFFKIAQLKYAGQWQPAPSAMHNLLDHLHKHKGLDVALKTEELDVANFPAVVDYKFIYLHGRGDFSYPADKLDKLRFNLENGGLLFSDACCGKPAFDKSFRKFAAELFPGRKLEEVPLDDELFSAKLNGALLNEKNIRCRIKGDADGEASPMRSMPPMLEGIKINGRWAVLYSKYDIGCALERHRSSDCLGYDPESAFKIAGAAVLYLLKMPGSK